MTTMALKKVNAFLREEWLQTIDALREQIDVWIRQEQGWSFSRLESEEREASRVGHHDVILWSIRTPDGEVRLEPIGRNYFGRGVLEMYAWPTSYRVRLVRNENPEREWNCEWKILTDSGIYLHQPWDREHFILLVQDLVRAYDTMPLN